MSREVIDTGGPKAKAMSRKSRDVVRRPIVARPPDVHGRVFVRVERCKGCRFCVQFCPENVLAMSSDFNGKGFHYPVVNRPEACVNCSLCATICPDYAILAFPAPPTDGAHEANRPGGPAPGDQ